MQTCYNCGRQVPDTTLICPDCGALVKRYTDAPPREQPNPQPNSYPLNPYQQNPYQQNPFQPVQPVDPTGAPQRVRLYGGIRAWLIFLIVFSAYMAFSSLTSVFLAANPAILDQMLEASGMNAVEGMEALVSLLREAFSQPLALPMCIAALVFYVAKGGCHLWLLLSGRRLAFRVSIGVSLAGMLVLLLGGGLGLLLYFLEPLLTWMGLKRFWPWMPK